MIKLIGDMLRQWEVGRVVEVDDDVTEIQFANQYDTLAIPVVVKDGQATIPAEFLQTGKPVVAFGVKITADDEVVVCEAIFPVKDRPRPADYIYEPVEPYTVNKAVQKALQEAKDSGDFTGPPGPKGDPGVVKYVVVNELPETGDNAIYLVPTAGGAEGNRFDEYIFVDGKWEKIGSVAVAVDMSGYVKNTDYAQAGKAGVVDVNPTDFGIGVYPHNGVLYITPADKAQIDAKTHARRPIVPSNLDYAVKKGLADSKEEWSEDEKTAARALVGAVGNTDYANPNTAGVVRVYNPGAGVSITNSGYLYVNKASNAEIDAKATVYNPIVPNNLDYAVKVGVTTNTIALTDEEKAAAQEWLGVTEQIGDIETALDGIIAIQEALIGGDEA